MKALNRFLTLLGTSLLTSVSIAQTTFVTEDYNKALWMSTRFFGAQRMTDANKTNLQQNWLVQDYLPSGVATSKKGVVFAQDADAGYDLSGGWMDCGDHVFFGQTGFYAGYMLGKTYDAFPKGFGDYYGYDYDGYRTSGDYSWEGAKGSPNGIPDVLDELKHQTDFFIKCAKNATTFYFEKGNGDYDHRQRVTAVKMQTNTVGDGGEPRPMWKNPNDASMPAMCAATLALMSRLYKPYDPAYATLCLTHAKYAYDYSMSKTGTVGAASGSFYTGNSNYQNGRAIMYAEMFMATNTNSYKTQALALTVGVGSGDVKTNQFYTFDYSNTGEIAIYCLAEIGHPSAKNAFNTRIQDHFANNTQYNTEGIYKSGGGWGKLRYVGNAALMVALYNKLNNSTTLDPKVYANVNYILGKNSGNKSYLVGFVPKDVTPVVTSPTQAHHRNLYLYEGNNNNFIASIPNKNKQFGALVGGALDGTYNDVWTEYVNTEVCVDYNVGLVGALAAIKAEKDPVTVNSTANNCAQPNLGADKSICGLGSITLSANLTNNGIRTFEWFKDGTSLGAASKTKTTQNITSAGTYKVIIDSLGACIKVDEITITASLPLPNLGGDFELCSPASKTVSGAVTGVTVNYEWSKNNIVIPTNTSANLLVTEAGSYKVTISATGCTSKSNQINVSSVLPATKGGTFCPTDPSSQASLEVLGSGVGPYQWFETATSTTVLKTGKIVMFKPNTTKNYFVKDIGAFSTSFGPATMSGSTTIQGERTQMQFIAYSNFDLTSIDVIKGNYGGSGNEDWTIDLFSDNNGSPGTVVKTSATTSLQKSDGDIQTIPVNLSITGNAAGTFYWLGIRTGATVKFLDNYNYTINNQALNGSTLIAKLTQGRHDNNTTNTGGNSFNWKISAGKSCDRVPVTATADCTVGINENEISHQLISLYPNPSQDKGVIANLSNELIKVEVYTILGNLMSSYELEESVSFGQDLPKGTYFIKVMQEGRIESQKWIKN
jgi:hypothetical protein